ncbi:MAG: CPBP family glutamic-type intramembrane protease [Terracidiphilus sp.]
MRATIGCMAVGAAPISGGEGSAMVRTRRRDFVELALAYGLILVVIWTPRPWQKLLWWVAAAVVATIACLSFDGLKAVGLRRANFLRSLWVAGLALLVAAVAVLLADRLHTLRLPAGLVAFIETYAAYALWAFVQQFLLQGFFLARLMRLLPGEKAAALAAATIFAAAHLPSPILTPVTLIWGFAACLLFLRYRNLYPLAMAHAILGIAIAVTVPGPVDHNMRVGLGYLTYTRTHHAIHSAQP